MSDEQVSIEDLTAAYIKIRAKLSELEEEHKAKVKDLKEQQQLISDHILNTCNELGSDSIKTPAGTVTRRVTSRYWTSDWESMHEFIRENDAMFLLEKRLNNKMVQEYLEDNPDKLPMGLQADRRYTVQVRKPTTK